MQGLFQNLEQAAAALQHFFLRLTAATLPLVAVLHVYHAAFGVTLNVTPHVSFHVTRCPGVSAFDVLG